MQCPVTGLMQHYSTYFCGRLRRKLCDRDLQMATHGALVATATSWQAHHVLCWIIGSCPKFVGKVCDYPHWEHLFVLSFQWSHRPSFLSLKSFEGFDPLLRQAVIIIKLQWKCRFYPTGLSKQMTSCSLECKSTAGPKRPPKRLSCFQKCLVL